MLIPKGTLYATEKSILTSFAVFSNLLLRKNKSLELLMCKNELCMFLFACGTRRFHTSSEGPLKIRFKRALFLVWGVVFWWQNFIFSHLSQEE